MENEKKIKNYIIILILLLMIVFLMQCIYNIFGIDDYTRAKRQAERFLNNNIYELEHRSKEQLHSKSAKVENYKGKSYSYQVSKEDNNVIKEYIQFEIDAQGMLGGQYWGIIYSPSNDLLDGNMIYIYNEKESTGKGNNIYIKQKIKDNWYFYFDDYDGRVDVSKILE